MTIHLFRLNDQFNRFFPIEKINTHLSNLEIFVPMQIVQQMKRPISVFFFQENFTNQEIASPSPHFFFFDRIYYVFQVDCRCLTLSGPSASGSVIARSTDMLPYLVGSGPSEFSVCQVKERVSWTSFACPIVSNR